MLVAGQSEGCANGATKYIVVPGQREVQETDKRPRHRLDAEIFGETTL